jgi:hypothetical protein
MDYYFVTLEIPKHQPQCHFLFIVLCSITVNLHKSICGWTPVRISKMEEGGLPELAEHALLFAL